MRARLRMYLMLVTANRWGKAALYAVFGPRLVDRFVQ